MKEKNNLSQKFSIFVVSVRFTDTSVIATLVTYKVNGYLTKVKRKKNNRPIKGSALSEGLGLWEAIFYKTVLFSHSLVQTFMCSYCHNDVNKYCFLKCA